MANILSIEPIEKSPTLNLIKKTWQQLKGLDKFTKLMVISVSLFVISTPFIVTNRQVFISRGQVTISITAVSLTTGSYNPPSGQIANTAVATTSAVTIGANKLALMWVVQGNGTAGTATLSNPNRTWTQIATNTPGLRRLTLYRSMTSVDTNDVITITSPAPTSSKDRANEIVWSLVEYGNVDTSGTNGSGAIAQFASRNYQNAGGSRSLSGSVTLSSPVNSGSAVAGGFAMGPSSSVFPGAGYSLVGGNPCITVCVQAEFRDNFAQLVDMSWSSSVHWMVIAAELKAAGGGSVTSTPTPSPTPGVSSSKIPLIDMGNQTYLGFSGGLYPELNNAIPVDHNSAGLSFSSKVQPLDTNGTPSPTGKIVLLSVGMSNTRNEWCKYSDSATTCSSESFMSKASVDSRVNKGTLIMVNGARGGQDAVAWTSPSSTNYSNVANSLTALGASEKQVQAIWLKQADKNPTISLPAVDADAYRLETHLGNIIRTLRVRYPNLQQVFISSRIYAGYATSTLNPEPYAYESGFSVKWLIESQINQMRTGTIDSRAGDLNYNTNIAPWIAWAPYLWADDNNPRSDGLVWLTSDYASDMTHPRASGVQKVANMLLNFFLTSPHTSSWFLAPGVTSTPILTPTSTPVVTPTPTPTLPVACTLYKEGSGTVTVEAENFHVNKATSSNWVLRSDIAGASGSKFMRAEPDVGINHNTAYAVNSPMLGFNVSFTTAGTYHVWVRGYSTNGSSDSVHVGLDGKEISTSDRINSFSSNNWTWHKNTMDGSPATLNITPGEHVINVWMREDGFRFDKIILTTNSAFVPGGTGSAQSQCVSSP